MSSNRLRGKLIDGEKVIKEWSSNDWTSILATNYRLFLIKDSLFNKQSIEAPYSEISSLEFSKRRPKERLIASLICGILYVVIQNFRGYIGLSYYGGYNFADIFSYFLLLLFVGFLVWFIIGINNLTIHIVGRKPVYVSKEIEELYYFGRLHLSDIVHMTTSFQTDDQQYQNMPDKYVTNS
jgi:hypothetical protein